MEPTDYGRKILDVNRNYSLADTFVDRLEQRILDLQKRLTPNQQLLVTAILGTGRELRVDFIGYSNPNLVAIDGIEMATGKTATLLVHQESVQLLCRIESLEPEKQRRDIGFRHDEN